MVIDSRISRKLSNHNINLYTALLYSMQFTTNDNAWEQSAFLLQTNWSNYLPALTLT